MAKHAPPGQARMVALKVWAAKRHEPISRGYRGCRKKIQITGSKLLGYYRSSLRDGKTSLNLMPRPGSMLRDPHPAGNFDLF